MVRTDNNRNHFNPLNTVLAPFIFVLIGLALIAMSLIMPKQDAASKDRCTVPVQAEVTGFDYSEHTDGNHSDAVTPVFKFEYSGKTYKTRVKAYSSSFRDMFAMGGVYTIYADPNNPNEIYSEEIGKSNSTAYLIIRMIGLGLIAAGVLAFVRLIAEIAAIGGAIGLVATEIEARKQKNE